MAQTPAGTDSGYCVDGAGTVAPALLYHDWRQWADLLADDDTRLADSATVVANTTLQEIMLWASGEVESAALIGQRYTRADLQTLATGTDPDTLTAVAGYKSGRAVLRKLVADLAHWALVERRHPGTDPKDVPGAAKALEMLERLRLGEAILPFAQTAAAGLPDNVETAPERSQQELDRPSIQAARLFGKRPRGQ